MVSGIAKTLSKFSFQFPNMLLRGLPTVIYARTGNNSYFPSGDLLVISRVTHTDQIMPLMKYWIPDVEVIQPASIRQQLAEDIQSALKRYTQPSNAP